MAGIVNFHSSPFFITILMVCSIICLASIISKIEARNNGFTIDLIHRDSPNSPLYNPYETHARRLNKAFQRSISRLARSNLPSTTNSAQSDVKSDNGQYLMKLSVGTPPFDVYGIVDTGSDLVWTQCLPCDQCYKQRNPIFEPTKSSTYKDIPCQSQQCHLLDTVSCSPQNPNVCNYSYGYAGGLTQGYLSKETITFTSTSGHPVSFPNIVFGCGHNNSGSFSENDMGLIGLGGGPISLISQMGSSIGGKKFSLCLVPFHSDPSVTSKLSLGTGSEVVGDGVVSTPMVIKQDPTYYFVTLEGISIGDKFLPFNSSSKVAAKGNIFIDSGTPPAILPQDFYNRLAQEVQNVVPMTPVKDPQLGQQLCYSSIPKGIVLTAHFEGADVQLLPLNTFIQAKENVFCFAMIPNTGDTGIFGNFAQMNFLIGFDLETRMVSFKPTDCTKSL